MVETYCDHIYLIRQQSRIVHFSINPPPTPSDCCPELKIYLEGRTPSRSFQNKAFLIYKGAGHLLGHVFCERSAAQWCERQGRDFRYIAIPKLAPSVANSDTLTTSSPACFNSYNAPSPHPPIAAMTPTQVSVTHLSGAGGYDEKETTGAGLLRPEYVFTRQER